MPLPLVDPQLRPQSFSGPPATAGAIGQLELDTDGRLYVARTPTSYIPIDGEVINEMVQLAGKTIPNTALVVTPSTWLAADLVVSAPATGYPLRLKAFLEFLTSATSADGIRVTFADVTNGQPGVGGIQIGGRYAVPSKGTADVVPEWYVTQPFPGSSIARTFAVFLSYTVGGTDAQLVAGGNSPGALFQVCRA